jgi:hypothetical protein
MKTKISDIGNRFWDKVDIRSNEECWEWKACNDWRYGVITINNIAHKAHRVAFILSYGYTPKSHICHTCDNTLCCNPNHLFEGTHTENHHDHARKGNYRNRSTLNEEAVKVIRFYIERGVPQIKLAKLYKVHKTTISAIKRREIWSWVAVN